METLHILSDLNNFSRQISLRLVQISDSFSKSVKNNFNFLRKKLIGKQEIQRWKYRIVEQVRGMMVITRRREGDGVEQMKSG